MLSVFDFVDYREYLQKAFELKRRNNPAFTESAFVRKAGLSTNSRGYFKLVVTGKRNLTSGTVRGFSDALGLNSKESIYFENVVYYNQSTKLKDRQYYLQRILAAGEGSKSTQFELLRSQYTYYSNWYLVAVRELVGLTYFDETPEWIAAQLRGKITPKQAVEAIAHLEQLQLIERNSKGHLVQTQSIIRYPGNEFNASIQKFHSEMLDRAKEALVDDEYEERRTSCVTLSCDRDRLPEMIQMVDEFRGAMARKFGDGSKNPDTIFQIGFQIFQLTPIKKGIKKKEK